MPVTVLQVHILNFLSKFSEVISWLVLKTDKVIITGDFDVHVDINSDSFSTAFMSLLDSVGFRHSVHTPTGSFNHTFDLVLI